MICPLKPFAANDGADYPKDDGVKTIVIRFVTMFRRNIVRIPLAIEISQCCDGMKGTLTMTIFRIVYGLKRKYLIDYMNV